MWSFLTDALRRLRGRIKEAIPKDMLSIKPGVRVLGIRPEMALAATIVNTAYFQMGYSCVITSGIEGRHSHGSRHYAGNGMDFRIRHIPPADHRPLALLIGKSLGNDFDVVLESDHIHVEFDPKTPY